MRRVPHELAKSKFSRVCEMFSRHSGVCAYFCVVLAGCATPSAQVEIASVTPEADRALVVGWGNTAGEAARLIFKPALGTLVSDLYVAKVNEQKISYGQNIARVTPGEYDLTITCGIYIDQRFFGSASVVHANLIAGRVYRLRAQPEARKCYPYLEEVTGKE